MLVIRLQRVGRKGHAQFRVVVQDSRRTPSSGRIITSLGHYNPHTKEAVINKEKAQFYLDNGAQPSNRMAVLLVKEGIKLPAWVKISNPKKRTVRNPEKLRQNQPKELPKAENEQIKEEPSSSEVAEKPEASESTEAEAVPKE